MTEEFQPEGECQLHTEELPIRMNIIRIAEQFSKLKDDNIIEEVVRYNLPIFKQTILDIKKEF